MRGNVAKHGVVKKLKKEEVREIGEIVASSLYISICTMSQKREEEKQNKPFVRDIYKWREESPNKKGLHFIQKVLY